MKNVVIIGGGISGLTAAHRLSRNNIDVRVLEAASTIGGNIRTIEKQGFRMEQGPHSFMGSAENVWRLVEELGLEPRIEPAAAVADNRFIFRDGRLLPLPVSPAAFIFTRLLSLRAKLRLMLEPFIPGRARLEDTAWDFFLRRFGREAATYIMGPFISGIYAGDIHQLGARAAFPKFWRFEKESGSMIRGALKYMKEKRKRLLAEGKTPRRGLFTIQGGLGNLSLATAAGLGDRVMTNTPVLSVQQGEQGFRIITDRDELSASAVIIATPPGATSAMLAQDLPDAARELTSIPMAPVALVHWSAANTHEWIPKGFGMLIPRLSGLGLLGTLFPSQLFRGRAPEGRELFASFYGGVQNPEMVDRPEDYLSDQVRRDHTATFKTDPGAPELVDILRKKDGIPQLLPDHPEKIEQILSRISQRPGLDLAGNYLTGVGVENAVESGFTAADRCLNYLETLNLGAQGSPKR